MRSISMLERLTFKFEGSVMQNAVCLGDVDNDGDHELVIGNFDGDLAVFKGNDPQPWKKCTGLGQISAVRIGDLNNEGRNVLVVLTADGWCYVFDFNKEYEDEVDKSTTPESSSPPKKDGTPEEAESLMENLVISEPALPTNSSPSANETPPSNQEVSVGTSESDHDIKKMDSANTSADPALNSSESSPTSALSRSNGGTPVQGNSSNPHDKSPVEKEELPKSPTANISPSGIIGNSQSPGSPLNRSSDNSNNDSSKSSTEPSVSRPDGWQKSTSPRSDLDKSEANTTSGGESSKSPKVPLTQSSPQKSMSPKSDLSTSRGPENFSPSSLNESGKDSSKSPVALSNKSPGDASNKSLSSKSDDLDQSARETPPSLQVEPPSRSGSISPRSLNIGTPSPQKQDISSPSGSGSSSKSSDSLNVSRGGEIGDREEISPSDVVTSPVPLKSSSPVEPKEMTQNKSPEVKEDKQMDYENEINESAEKVDQTMEDEVNEEDEGEEEMTEESPDEDIKTKKNVEFAIGSFEETVPVMPPQFQACFRQRMPANVKEALIFDVNNDGLNELVLALTDRVVRAYQWQTGKEENSRYPTETLISMNKWEFASQVGSITQNINADGSNTLIVAQPGGTLLKLKCGASAQTPISERREKTPDELIGDLDFEPLVVRQMRNFNVSCEIQGGFKVMKREDRDDDTLVGSDGKDPKGEEEAQEMADKEKCEDEQVDGGPNETLVHSEGDKGASSDAVENKLPRRQQFNDPQDSGEKGSPGKLKYIDTPADPNNVDSRDMVDPLELSENVNDPERRDMSREREATVKKEIWSIQRDFKPAVKTGPPRGVKSSPYAVATLDGTVLLVQDEEVLFHLVTHQQLFCVRKLDIRGIGQDDIVLSSWNGYTFVVTQGQGVMQFVFEDVISTFTCGSYTVDEHTNANGEVIPKETVPVFVYVTFKHEIYIYHKLKVETEPLKTLLYQDPDSEFAKLLVEHNIEIEDENQLAELNEFLLYKRPRAKKELIPREKSVDSDEEESDEEERSEAFEEDAGNDEDHVEKDLCEDDSPKI